MKTLPTRKCVFVTGSSREFSGLFPTLYYAFSKFSSAYFRVPSQSLPTQSTTCPTRRHPSLPFSGSNFPTDHIYAAIEIAKKIGKGKKVLAIAPDGGEKYISMGIY